jgi:hypothetical protein
MLATDLAKPREVLKNRPEGSTDPAPLGRIIGKCKSLKHKADATGRQFVELVGAFKGIPAAAFELEVEENGTKRKVLVEQIVSTVAALPIAVHDVIVKERGKKDVAEVHFAFDVAVKKSSNPPGYEFVCTPVFPITAAVSDEFADIDAKIATLAGGDTNEKAQQAA